MLGYLGVKQFRCLIQGCLRIICKAELPERTSPQCGDLGPHSVQARPHQTDPLANLPNVGIASDSSR
ncbi:hypothetical protein [Streptomyces sp. NPDC003857]